MSRNARRIVNRHCLLVLFATCAAVAFAWIAALAHGAAFDLRLLADKGDPSRNRAEVESLWAAARRADLVAIGAQAVVTLGCYLALWQGGLERRARVVHAVGSFIGGIVLTLLMALIAWTTQSDLEVRTDQLIHALFSAR
jgi:hypothetical protein